MKTGIKIRGPALISVPIRGGSLLFPDSHLLKLTHFVTNSLYHRRLFVAITQKRFAILLCAIAITWLLSCFSLPSRSATYLV